MLLGALTSTKGGSDSDSDGDTLPWGAQAGAEAETTACEDKPKLIRKNAACFDDDLTPVSIKKRPSETTNHNQPAKKPCLSTTRVTGEDSQDLAETLALLGSGTVEKPIPLTVDAIKIPPLRRPTCFNETVEKLKTAGPTKVGSQRVEKKPKGKKEADKGAKTAKAVAPKASFKRPGAKAVAKKRNDTMIEPDLNPASPFYGEYSLAFIPKSAWPSLQRTHRGVHSYTVEYKGALLDVLLRSAAFYVKRAVKEGRSGSVAFSKWGGPEQAWKIALRLAGVPNEED
ncbi:unnamed protein product [Effrenium voratum]|nr:unnamed protein product [Effrenium voratum]